MRNVPVMASVLLLVACGSAPPHRGMACATARPPLVEAIDEGSNMTTTMSVLTYNIEGLGWPARKGRAAQLRKIGDHLRALRESGSGPDVVLFQEVFSGPAKKAVMSTGYPAIVSGPRRTTRPDLPVPDPLPGKAAIKHGEMGIHLAGGGLAIASRYPIVSTRIRAFGRKSCAGLDCLSNKGIMLAKIQVPGLPAPIELYNTHLNSRGASRAPAVRHFAAHDRQSLNVSAFVQATHADGSPIIFGGDFNMRKSEERWENFSRYQALTLVHKVCADNPDCDVRMSWDGDEPWMDTQDLQFFWSGTSIAIRPIKVESMFDGRPGQPALSDHDGLMVTYELKWPKSPVGSGC